MLKISEVAKSEHLRLFIGEIQKLDTHIESVWHRSSYCVTVMAEGP